MSSHDLKWTRKTKSNSNKCCLTTNDSNNYNNDVETQNKPNEYSLKLYGSNCVRACLYVWMYVHTYIMEYENRLKPRTWTKAPRQPQITFRRHEASFKVFVKEHQLCCERSNVCERIKINTQLKQQHLPSSNSDWCMADRLTHFSKQKDWNLFLFSLWIIK